MKKLILPAIIITAFACSNPKIKIIDQQIAIKHKMDSIDLHIQEEAVKFIPSRDVVEVFHDTDKSVDKKEAEVPGNFESKLQSIMLVKQRLKMTYDSLELELKKYQ